MADKLVIYNPESNDASHTPSDTVKGDITVNGTIKADNVNSENIRSRYINLFDKYTLSYDTNVGNVRLEPPGNGWGANQTYVFGDQYGIFIKRILSSSPYVIYSESNPDPSQNTVMKMDLSEVGDIWGNQWKNNGRPGYQNMLSEYIDTLTTGNLTSGWTRLQNGLLLQWGTIQDPNNGSWGKITFPTAFTKIKSVHVAISDLWNNDSWVPVVYIDRSDTDLAGQGIICRMINGTAGPATMKNWVADWFAIGY